MSFFLELADELAFLAAALLAGLLVEGRALDVPREPFFLARLLEALEELIETLVHPDFDANQTRTSQGLSGARIIAKASAARQHFFCFDVPLLRKGDKSASQILRPSIFRERLDNREIVSYKLGGDRRLTGELEREGP
jgi:hypothetical protein